jgi:hypothetical protein
MENKSLKPAITLIVMLLAVGLAGISCKKENAAKTQTPNVPPAGHPEMVEALKKGLQEAKKVSVAQVNGVAITMHELIAEMNLITPQYLKPGQKKDQQLQERVKHDALDILIFRELALQDAKKKGMRITPEAGDEALKAFKADLKSEDAYRDYLSARGITEAELRQNIEKDLLFRMITAEEIFNKVKADPKKGRDTYTMVVNKRKEEWEKQLKKTAAIEVTLDKFEKKIRPAD